MSFSTEYDQISDMRREDDPSLEQGEWVHDLKVADWQGVVDLGQELLQNRTKDLRLSGWLTEALLKTQGFAGLSHGLQLCTALCDTFWVDLYPQAEDDYYDERIGNISWILKQIEKQIKFIPLLNTSDGNLTALAIEVAKHHANSSQHDEDITNDDSLTIEDIKRHVDQTDNQQLLQLYNSVQDVEAALKGFDDLVDEKLEADGPSFGKTNQALEEVKDTVIGFLRQKGLSDTHGNLLAAPDPDDNSSDTIDDSEDEFSVLNSEQLSDGNSAASNGPIQNRRQAIRQLREISAFFKRTEPHSPVAHLAEKAANWGTMSLHDWLRSVVKDESSLAHVEELLGVESVKEQDDDDDYDSSDDD